MTEKNVILIVLDTHRFDRIGAYGYGRPTTPNLDDFAGESLFFERAVAPGQWTIPSHASLFSGEVPAVHGTLQADIFRFARFNFREVENIVDEL
ncbi:MAG: sulfatase-like hydrolase/transferase [Chloroflexota bacterium]|nr:sulfatase-like hydrolase/transferase [Chloroflexota bacterium]